MHCSCQMMTNLVSGVTNLGPCYTGAASQLQSRGGTLRTPRPGMPQLRTGNSTVAFNTTKTALYSHSTLTRGGSSAPSSPIRGGMDLNRPVIGQIRAGPLDRAGPSGRAGLNRMPSRAAPPPTPAPSPAGSPSIGAVYKPMQRSPEAQYRASRLRPIQSAKLRCHCSPFTAHHTHMLNCMLSMKNNHTGVH